MKHTNSGAYIAQLMSVDRAVLPEDGGERFNRLIFARSPYLLQHAENPVDWYEWGEAPFARARAENRPVFLSIGYATCHWCHVMAHESFEDPEVAALLNTDFVCIKVDREERPDIDDFYMTVSQVLTGSGGWPLNIFLTPDRRPFFAMTYLPKRGRSGMTGLMELLANISTLWKRQPDRIEKNCSGIMEALGHLSAKPSQRTIERDEIAELALEQLIDSYDREYGGFGSAPKFPMATNLGWLIGHGVSAGKTEAVKMALHTLRSIRQGGIWDQIGGGIHRYAVDREWLVPHFEKMLYDQAMIAWTSLQALQATGEPFFGEMAENVFRFVGRELTAEGGGFYSALDADTEGIEGKFYLWDRTEVEQCLGAQARLFCSFYDITAEGNFEGRSIPNMPVPLQDFCTIEGLERDETEQRLEEGRARLFACREQRVRPLRDEKILTAWNGLMIAALAKGGAIAGSAPHVDAAGRAAAFVLENLRRRDGRLLRSFLGRPGDVPAFLEDYAFLCHGLIELFEASLKQVWLDKALWLADEMTRLFYDPGPQLFSKVGRDAEQMPMQASLEHDGVIPSPFSLAGSCYVRLGHALERPELLDLAHVLLGASLADARRHPTAHLVALQAYERLEEEPVVVQLQGRPGSSRLAGLLLETHSHPLSTLVIQYREMAGEGQAQVCARAACHPPVTTREDLRQLLRSIS